jgi:IS30 family transposase
MMFAKYGQAILTVHERKPCLLLAIRRLISKAAHSVARNLVNRVMPPPQRQTVTFDNGTEFARHRALHSLSIDTFFCDPYAPWQKGGIENAIGRMRRFSPQNRSRHPLKSPFPPHTRAEVFAQQMLQFECEFTSRPSRGRRLGYNF